MWLSIQIAIGIVLAYAIIANRVALLRLGKTAAIIALAGAVGIAAIVLAGSAVEAIRSSPGASRAVSVILMFPIALLFFGAGALGGKAGFDLVRRAFNASWVLTDGRVVASAFSNIMLTGSVMTLAAESRFGGTLSSIDRWSRQNGWADAGFMALWGAALLWPALLWLVVNWFSPPRRIAPVQSVGTE